MIVEIVKSKQTEKETTQQTSTKQKTLDKRKVKKTQKQPIKTVNKLFHIKHVTRNFLGQGSFLQIRGTLINIHLQHEKERLRREKIYGFFP